MNTYLLAVGCLIIVCYLQQFSCGAPASNVAVSDINQLLRMIFTSHSHNVHKKSSQMLQNDQETRDMQYARYVCSWNKTLSAIQESEKVNIASY